MLLNESKPFTSPQECSGTWGDDSYSDSHSDDGGPGWGDQHSDGGSHSDAWSDR